MLGEGLSLCELRFDIRNSHFVHQFVPQRSEAIELIERYRFCRREYELRRVKRLSVPGNPEIEMRSGCESAGTHFAYNLSLIDSSPDFHVNFRKVQVLGLIAARMTKVDHVAVCPFPPGAHHYARTDGLDRRSPLQDADARP